MDIIYRRWGLGKTNIIERVLENLLLENRCIHPEERVWMRDRLSRREYEWTAVTMKGIRSKILIGILAIVIAGMGCTEKIVYEELSPRELLANGSEYIDKHVSLEGEIRDGMLDGAIKLENISDTIDDYGNAGIYAALWGTFSDQNDTPLLKVEDVKPVLVIAIENETYHSGEMMHVNVTVFAESELSDVELTVSGLTNKLGRDKIREVRYVNLSPGENEIPFTFTTPSCTGCAKLDPGIHSVTATLVMNSRTMNATTTMILER